MRAADFPLYSSFVLAICHSSGVCPIANRFWKSMVSSSISKDPPCFRHSDRLPSKPGAVLFLLFNIALRTSASVIGEFIPIWPLAGSLLILMFLSSLRLAMPRASLAFGSSVREWQNCDAEGGGHSKHPCRIACWGSSSPDRQAKCLSQKLPALLGYRACHFAVPCEGFGTTGPSLIRALVT